jgi:predicted ATPase
MKGSIRLKGITIKGYKSIKELENFNPGALTVLIGANGAGKSNFISFFRMMSWMMQNPGSLQAFIGQNGRASSFLHDGPQKTREIEGHFVFETREGENEYAFRLTYAAGDTLIFTDERYRFSRKSFGYKNEWTILTPMGHLEAHLPEQAEAADRTARSIITMLRACVVYQFHNTSFTSRIRSTWAVSDSRWLKEDGANLPAFLYRLREMRPEYYRRIVEYLRLSIPFFADFVLVPENNRLLLQWKEIGGDTIFDSFAASDGMLRYMALVSLLAQPPDEMPDILILDEPELGLHPYAINIIAGLVKTASRNNQIILATQSPVLIDHFQPEEIVVLDRIDRESSFHKLDPSSLKEWMDSYTISELWEKNVLGGRPSK